MLVCSSRLRYMDWRAERVLTRIQRGSEYVGVVVVKETNNLNICAIFEGTDGNIRYLVRRCEICL